MYVRYLYDVTSPSNIAVIVKASVTNGMFIIIMYRASTGPVVSISVLREVIQFLKSYLRVPVHHDVHNKQFCK